MEQKNWIREVETLFSEKLAIRVDSPDKDLLQAGMLDSMALVELLMGLEERFGLRLNLAELEIDQFRSVRSVAGMVATAQPLSMGSAL